jgi:FkbM family methyltransferase
MRFIRRTKFLVLWGVILCLSISSFLRYDSPPRSPLRSDAALEQPSYPTGTSKQDSTGDASLSEPPLACTSEQLATIQRMLPDRKTLRLSTNCPDALWLEDPIPFTMITTTSRKADSPSRKTPPTAIFAGCNKALDAVNTLRMFSFNPEFDKPRWGSAMGIRDSACGQHTSPQYVLFNDTKTKTVQQPRPREAKVYCIEAMPSTFTKLDRIVKELGWQKSLQVFHAAVSDREDPPTILFPNAKVGTEYLGIQGCSSNKNNNTTTKKQRNNKHCQEVPQMTLDSFVRTHKIPEIDFLSVDVEGNDWPVLLGALNWTLPKVKYLEFEYHKVGRWKDIPLQPAIDTLQRAGGGFICYWAGRMGKLWRITDCWMDHYDEWKEWSNVACVQRKLAPTLAARMEARFLKTLKDYQALQTRIAGNHRLHDP